MDLSSFSPVCLPYDNKGQHAEEGHVYGEIRFIKLILLFQGWGDSGTTDFSTDKLKKTTIPIVPSSTCLNKMNINEAVNEDLLVCAGGSGTGTCKVFDCPSSIIPIERQVRH